MLDAAEQAQRFMQGKHRKDLDADPMLVQILRLNLNL
jgi:hypothetical protein